MLAGWAGACLATAWACPVLAQEPAPGSPPAESPAPPVPEPESDPNEGRLIREILVVRPATGEGAVPDALEPVSEEVRQLVRNQLRSDVGRPYRKDAAAGDLVRLNKVGRFRYIETRVQPQTDGSVVLMFVVVEQPIIRDVQSVGNRLLSDQEIIETVDQLVGTPVDRFQLDRACRQIEDLYRAKGYYLARVSVDEKVLEETGDLILIVREGERIKVTDIRFDGNLSFTPRELKTAIKTRRAFPLFEKGPMDDDVLAEDVAGLIQFYRERGYLDVRADRRYSLAPSSKEAIVTFLIDEGPVYTLRGVRVRYRDTATVQRYEREAAGTPAGVLKHVTPEQARRVGAGVFDENQIIGIMNVKPGDVYGIKAVDQGVKAVESAYGRLGYTTARVEARREVRGLDRPEVDLVLFIIEGDRHRTGEVRIQGDTITRQSVIAREVRVHSDRPLDTSALDETQRRLEELRLFQPGSVNVTMQPPDEEGYRDVLVEVKETNTGQLGFGVSVDTDAGLIGSLTLKQSNFDLFNPPTSFSELGRAFRGGGQTFTIDLAPGSETQTYSVSLLEPHVLETDASLTGTGYYRTRDYDQYDEQRYGARFGLGRRFGSRLNAGLTFRGEWVALSDIEADSPVDYFDWEDRRFINGLEFRLSRSTTDRALIPTRGTRISTAVEQVGIIDDEVSFTRFSADYSAYFTLNETFEGLKTVLSFDVRADYIPQGPDDVPVYERFYLGGRTIRGLEFRTVSPRGLQQNGQPAVDPVGGTWSFYAGAEVQQPVHPIVGIAMFVDTGTVTDDPGFDDYRVTVGLGLRLNVRALTPVPLAFDFGFPILKEDTDEERLFTFSLDIPF